MSTKKKDLGESFLHGGELLGDEDEDSDSLLADELRGMYRNRLKDMEEVEEKREEAHRVRSMGFFSHQPRQIVNSDLLNIRSLTVKFKMFEHENRNCFTPADKQCSMGR